MTTITGRDYDDRVKGSGFNTRAALTLWLLSFLLGGIMFVTLDTPLGRIAVQDNHAVERHGEAEVESIRQCLMKNGADMVWSKLDDPGIKIFCMNMDKKKACGKWGVLFAQFWPSITEQCDYRELTAFVPRDGTYHRVVKYLTNFAKRLQ